MGNLSTAPSLITAIQTCECGTRIDVGKFDLFQEVLCPTCSRTVLVTGHLDRFELVGRIAKSTGTIYKAYDPHLGRCVALRVVKMDPSIDEEVLAQLENDTLTIASLSHPNLLRIFETGRAQERFYISMEIAEGGTLGELIHDYPALPEGQALEIVYQIAAGLDAAFQAGLVHRDVKPSNILFSDSVGVVADFGLVRLEEHLAGGAGYIWGGPFYLPPERLSGLKEDFRSDIYALGSLFFEMLSGRPPFHSGTPQEIAMKRLNHAAPSVLTFAPGVSDSTALIVKRMLEKERKARFQSYRELLERLNSVREELKQKKGGRKETRVVVNVPMQRKAASWMALIFAGFFVVAAIVGITMVRKSRARNAISEIPPVTSTSSSLPVANAPGATAPKAQNGNAQPALASASAGADSLTVLRSMAPAVFRFVNVTNNWSLHVASAGLDNNSLVTSWHNGNMPNSHWVVRPVNAGYQLIAFHSYKALEAMGEPGDEKSAIRQENLHDSLAQVWRIESADNGACRLISVATGKALAIGDPRAINVSVIGQTASPGNMMEQWKIEFVRSTPAELSAVPTGDPQINSPPAFEAKKTVEPLGGRFVPINIAANRDSRDPKAFEEYNTNPILRIAKPGWMEVNGVPFQIIDVARAPGGKDQMILKGPFHLSRNYPNRIELSVANAPLTKLHFLGGVAGWGLIPNQFPTGGRFGAIVVNVTVERMGGVRESFQLRNGLEIIDWVAQNDVPLSTRVLGISTDGFFRYFAKELTTSGSVTKIILESDGNCAAPVFLAITGETKK